MGPEAFSTQHNRVPHADRTVFHTQHSLDLHAHSLFSAAQLGVMRGPHRIFPAAQTKTITPPHETFSAAQPSPSPAAENVYAASRERGVCGRDSSNACAQSSVQPKPFPDSVEATGRTDFPTQPIGGGVRPGPHSFFRAAHFFHAARA